jgi:hypothetical protein
MFFSPMRQLKNLSLCCSASGSLTLLSLSLSERPPEDFAVKLQLLELYVPWRFEGVYFLDGSHVPETSLVESRCLPLIISHFRRFDFPIAPTILLVMIFLKHVLHRVTVLQYKSHTPSIVGEIWRPHLWVTCNKHLRRHPAHFWLPRCLWKLGPSGVLLSSSEAVEGECGCGW